MSRHAAHESPGPATCPFLAEHVHPENRPYDPAFADLSFAVADDLAHPRMLELIALANTGARRRELQALVRRALPSLVGLEPARVLELATALSAHGLLAEAYAIAAHEAAAGDHRLAHSRADWAMQLGDYAAAIAAADVAIEGLLHPGLSLQEFLRLCARGAPLEGLLRYERGAVARVRHLHEPLAIRWQALQRTGRKAEAGLMRLVCLRHFSDRASVWAAAGNQALDEGAPDQAERFFDRCLHLDHAWTAALAGKAIVYELRKDWDRALAYRARVVESTAALARTDPPSLQRTIRYAAALGRVGRWHEADVLLRRAVRLGAYARLPAERPVLLRVFSRELYAPAWIAACWATHPDAPAQDELIGLALYEAEALAQLSSIIQRALSLEPRESGLLLGMCAWLAGDDERAYALIDDAELGEGDVAAQHLLLSSALTIDAPELPSIAQFAEQAAHAALRAESASDELLLYALATRALLEPSAALAPPAAVGGRLVALYRAALATPDVACLELTPEPGSVPAQLRRIVAFRAAQRALRRPPLMAAAASARALRAMLELQA